MKKLLNVTYIFTAIVAITFYGSAVKAASIVQDSSTEISSATTYDLNLVDSFAAFGNSNGNTVPVTDALNLGKFSDLAGVGDTTNSVYAGGPVQLTYTGTYPNSPTPTPVVEVASNAFADDGDGTASSTNPPPDLTGSTVLFALTETLTFYTTSYLSLPMFTFTLTGPGVTSSTTLTPTITQSASSAAETITVSGELGDTLAYDIAASGVTDINSNIGLNGIAADAVVTPEPGTYVLLSLGLVFLFMAMRNRRFLA
jgi:hypothetical protein